MSGQGQSNGAVKGPKERVAAQEVEAAVRAQAAEAAERAQAAEMGVAMTEVAVAEAAEKLVEGNKFPQPFSGDIKNYNDIVKIGCKYRKYLSSIMQNVSIDNDKRKKLILHVRSILYCYIINIGVGLVGSHGLNFFNKAKAFFENVKNEDKLRTMLFNGPKYSELLDGDVYGEIGSAFLGDPAYYPKILAGDGKGYEVGQELVEANGEIKKEGDTGSGAVGGKVSRVGKKKRTTKKKGTTKKRKVKRRKYSLKR